MKSFFYGLLISSALFSQHVFAECSKVPGPDGTVPKCLPADALVNSELTDAQVRDAFLGPVMIAQGYSVDELVAKCTIVSEESTVSSVPASECSFPKGKPGIINRVCQFNTKFKCNVNGGDVYTNRKGSCLGQMHDCGTFKYCADDQTKFVCAKQVWLKSSKADSFHTADMVPKGAPPVLNGNGVNN